MHNFKALGLCFLLLNACVVEDAFPVREASEPRIISQNISLHLKNSEGKAQVSIPYILSLGTQQISRGQSNAEGEITLPELLIDHLYFLQLGENPVRLQRHLSPPLEGGQIEIIYPDNQSYLQGQIVNAQGQGIANAVIQLKSESTLSNKTGKFSILKPETLTNEDVLSVIAPDYYKQQVDVLPLQEDFKLSLSPHQKPRRLRWPENNTILGLKPEVWQKQSQTLREIAQSLGFEIKGLSTQEDLAPEQDILLLMPVSDAFTQQDIVQWTAFIQAGGKAIILSEWAGFTQASPTHLQALLHALGFYAGNDSLSQTASQMEVLDFVPHALTQDVKSLALMRSSSVGTLNPQQANNLAFAPSEHYQILVQRGPQAILTAGLVGLGKVIVMGDSSWILNHDSDGNGIVNIAEADNALFWENILNW